MKLQETRIEQGFPIKWKMAVVTNTGKSICKQIGGFTSLTLQLETDHHTF